LRVSYSHNILLISAHLYGNVNGLINYNNIIIPRRGIVIKRAITINMKRNILYSPELN